MRHLSVSAPSLVQGIGFDTQEGPELWLANLTPQSQDLEFAAPVSAGCMLDAAHFVEASRSAEFMDELRDLSGRMAVTLGPFALARLRLSG